MYLNEIKKPQQIAEVFVNKIVLFSNLFMSDLKLILKLVA